ncbi:ferritin family protein [Methanolobus zinderi]|jgi:rubrerythrin|uniref:Ferritin family protein n=1 Tax=Methanolobus zinderi TaxID=536044 RepID=A0A7D5IQ97_9EURY|nr:ferritin family protein [Methanolobus zinderi]KXS44890.1 MAG: rubrerythrin [Methanolobus sp. T82-4]QLC50885.1 ferritin family protein [Methanolobus zinderi]
MKDVLHEIAEKLDRLESIDEAIAMAIELEEEGREYYLERASSMEHETGKSLYKFLADEEKKHAEYLRQYRESKKAPVVEFEYPDFKASFREEFSDKTLEEVGVLLGALRFEHKSEFFYEELAKKATDQEQKEFFENMEDVERSHYRIIEELLDYATQFRMQT